MKRIAAGLIYYSLCVLRMKALQQIDTTGNTFDRVADYHRSKHFDEARNGLVTACSTGSSTYTFDQQVPLDESAARAIQRC